LKQLYIIFIFVFSFCFAKAQSQSITGTWEGDLGGTEFLQINVQQVGDNICGYTWDYLYGRKKDYCKAYFDGYYNKTKDIWTMNGYSFMENSGSHVLMQLKCMVDYEGGELVMNGVCRTSASSFFPAGEPMTMRLKKVSNKPTIVTQTMRDCVKTFEDRKKAAPIKPIVPKFEIPVPKKPIVPKKEDTVKKPAIPKPVKPVIITPKKPDPKPPVIVAPKPLPKPVIKKVDTIVKKTPHIAIKTTPAVILPKKINGRDNKEISRIVVNDRKIKLELYDNGTIDGDSISVFYNGKLIASHQKLSTKPITIDLVLDENTNIHSIVMFAENLGSIPPNTALIIFTTPTGRRYELFASASLEQNAELIFEYKPK
jgi:hypothetical protein